MIFVFGSNLAGRHGSGAAKYAFKERGAIYGLGEGPMGTSYALPTMDWEIYPLTLFEIQEHVNIFLKYAHDCSAEEFQITQLGCGLGGKTKEEIAPMFINAPDNCLFDEAWRDILGDEKRYWGTF